MNILFLSISSIASLAQHSLSTDLLREFQRNGHQIFVICALDKDSEENTFHAEEEGCRIVRVKIGENKKANLIRKGITTLTEPGKYIQAIDQYYSDVKFDLVLYPTPPITQAKVVSYVKRRDGAASYLILRDIFPQNAVDIGMLRMSGWRKMIVQYFRKVEKELYRISDYIGCLSQANVEYVLRHNAEVDPEKIEVCTNSIEVYDKSADSTVRAALREKYGIPQNLKVFIYGGNLGKPQGISFFLKCMDAVKEIDDAYFLVIGDGTEYGKLERYLAESEQQNLKLMKKLPKEDYDRLVAACDVGLIFLDHRFTIPNYPSRLLSYMQTKLPVIAMTDPNTDVGAAITEGGFGWWNESNDVSGFVEAVQSALHAELASMGEKGYAYLEQHFSVTRQYRTIMRHFDSQALS